MGVGTGVFWLDETAVSGTVGRLRAATSPVTVCPSSPAVKERVEQKPSEDDIKSVRPSFDLQT